ncbi:MAG: chromosome partitioning protein ParB [Acidimicrobiia bacterium]
MSTGFPDADARDDFSRLQRQRALAWLRDRLRRSPHDADQILLFDEVTRVLGRVGQRSLGVQVVPLDTIVGTVDRERGFDRQFRPTTVHHRQRWERLDAAMRRGESMPPVELYRVGELHFVRDGHHRVSVAKALGLDTVEANVTEVLTAEPALSGTRASDLPVLDHRRALRERVPLSADTWARIQLSDPWDYALLAEGVEAWGFRRSLGQGELLDRKRVAELWFREEYVPVVGMLRDADLIGHHTETEAYLRLAAERYRLLRTHAWTEDVIERLRSLRHGG